MQQVWTSETEGALAGVPVRCVTTDYAAHKTTEAEIIVLKPRSMIHEYLSLSPNPRRIIEVGVHQGGSALLLADMYPTAAILGIDWARGNPAIGQHIERLGYTKRMRLHFGVSQDDAERLPEFVQRAFGDRPADLIIDDASHNYGYTTRCFEILFPRLEVGGLYVVEDWAWSYRDTFQGAPSITEGGIPLSDMAHELLAAAAIWGTVSLERVQQSMFAVRKLGELPPFAEIREAARRRARAK
jgi:predicted O-methyltransferase YrrM